MNVKDIEIPKAGKRLYYHNEDHVKDMINMYNSHRLKSPYLYAAILFHDCVYSIRSDVNETYSACHAYEFLNKNGYDHTFCQRVHDIIESTSVSKSIRTKEDAFINYFDLKCFFNPTKVVEHEYKIFKEYNPYNYSKFKKERMKYLQEIIPNRIGFIKDISPELDVEAINAGIYISKSFLSSFKPKIGLYVGSFNPFHIGHMNITEQAERVFDKIVIVQALNPSKEHYQNALPDKVQDIYECVRADKGLLITEIIHKIQHQTPEPEYTLIRGVRNSHDLNDEMNYLNTIKDMGLNIPVQYILTEPEYQHVSSSMIRQLKSLHSGIEEAKKYLIL